MQKHLKIIYRFLFYVLSVRSDFFVRVNLYLCLNAVSGVCNIVSLNISSIDIIYYEYVYLLWVTLSRQSLPWSGSGSDMTVLVLQIAWKLNHTNTVH